ncbi:tail protein [Nitratidesulfovibrio vulgaris]|uniref:Tail fiber protein, putative n=1 Tax=Nitratidesulfovibrio vulgaris (strain ATCC 29579 / DSM 644 / CCUG 34227 / NCIMB 8303 / VKM B-1760 / Hildenborough) TaxID=882 RepID=Q727K6_NITV2|nr:tail protein [Nitratidesulfovibrio vulgaris]AAS97321.1 tail fiber protein, putative [Nitratidesulfovibrio vulgaris str. Hildenborough]ADP87771.1 tail fibre protein, putative [Nitratidesulfovibrio vulgaris RCH1]
MHRIDGPGATQDNRFTDGDPTAGIPPTIVTDDWANAVQEELSGVVEGAGLTLDKAKHDQLKAAITKMITDRAAPLATTEQAGLVERATDAEAQAGTDGERYVTPKQLVAVMRDMLGGAIIEWEAAAIPTLTDGKPLGLELNGSVVSLATFPRLLRKWAGAGSNATTPAWFRCTADGVRDAAGAYIRLQDRRAEFARGWDHGRGVDTGRVLGSAQGHMIESHQHDLRASRVGTAGSTAWAYSGITGENQLTMPTGGIETRPRNVAVMYLILV